MFTQSHFLGIYKSSKVKKNHGGARWRIAGTRRGNNFGLMLDVHFGVKLNLSSERLPGKDEVSWNVRKESGFFADAQALRNRFRKLHADILETTSGDVETSSAEGGISET